MQARHPHVSALPNAHGIPGLCAIRPRAAAPTCRASAPPALEAGTRGHRSSAAIVLALIVVLAAIAPVRTTAADPPADRLRDMERMIDAAINTLMHEPTMQLRKLASQNSEELEQATAVLDDLFGLARANQEASPDSADELDPVESASPEAVTKEKIA